MHKNRPAFSLTELIIVVLLAAVFLGVLTLVLRRGSSPPGFGGDAERSLSARGVVAISVWSSERSARSKGGKFPLTQGSVATKHGDRRLDGSWPSLPKAGDAISVKLRIGTDDGETFRNRLGNDQTVERVAMVKWQIRNEVQVFGGNLQPLKKGTDHVLVEKTSESAANVELLPADFDGDFPWRRKADELAMGRIAKKGACRHA